MFQGLFKCWEEETNKTNLHKAMAESNILSYLIRNIWAIGMNLGEEVTGRYLRHRISRTYQVFRLISVYINASNKAKLVQFCSLPKALLRARGATAHTVLSERDLSRWTFSHSQQRRGGYGEKSMVQAQTWSIMHPLLLLGQK